MLLKRTLVLTAIMLGGCMPNDQAVRYSVTVAVERRDIDRVRSAIAAGGDLEFRNDAGSTPLLIATGSGQFVIAEVLIDAGADVFATAPLGQTTGRYVEVAAYPPGMPEGDARVRIRGLLADRGFPFPAPLPEQVVVLRESGDWPPPRAKTN